MENKLTIIAILGALVLIGSVAVLTGNAKEESSVSAVSESVDNVEVVNGVQYITIIARGGYTPKVTKAKADIPTVIRMETKKAYDCSLALVIPDIKYQKYLQPTGIEEIEIPLENTQGILRGMCSMAMYHFQIDFE